MMKVYEVRGFTGMCKDVRFTKYFNTEENARNYVDNEKWDYVTYFAEKTVVPNENGEFEVVNEKVFKEFLKIPLDK